MQASGGEQLEPVVADTRATAIRIGNPASWKKAVRIIRATGGWVEEVSEQEIAQAKAEIGAEGIGCEPASAVTLAGLKKLTRDGRIGREERVVLLLTGHTLKDPEYTIDFHRGTLFSNQEASSLRKPPIVLEAQTEAVLKALESNIQL
jgi:threonine synthase